MGDNRGMKQRCSVSCITWTCISRFTFILILGCIGCGKPPMFHIVARNELANESERYKIFLKGQELGTVTGRARSNSMLRAGGVTPCRTFSPRTSRSEYPGFADG